MDMHILSAEKNKEIYFYLKMKVTWKKNRWNIYEHFERWGYEDLTF